MDAISPDLNSPMLNCTYIVARFFWMVGILAQEKLKFSNVCIVGCGGIGCALAELLARAGVGKITLIDPDTIEMSNLQRQLAFTPNDLGFYKAEILAKRLAQINPNVQVEYINQALTTENAESIIEHQDLVLDGCDQFETRYLVNQSCVKLNAFNQCFCDWFARTTVHDGRGFSLLCLPVST